MAMKKEDRPVRDDSRLQANVNYGTPSPLDRYWERVGYPDKKKDSPGTILKKVRGSIPYAS